MNVKKCDRCGMLIDTENLLNLAMNSLVDMCRNVVATFNGKPRLIVFTHDKQVANLCPECKRSFEKWVSEGDILVITEKEKQE